MTNSLDTLLQKLRSLIAENNFDLALSLIKSWLDLLVFDFRLYGKVFMSKELDQICLEIGANTLKQMLPLNSPNSTKCSSVFVTSELFVTGGHTKLILDYIQVLKQDDIKILITDPGNNVNEALIKEYFSNIPVELKFSPRFVPLLDKLKWLMQNLAELNPKDCYLFNHPNDPIAIAAMQSELVESPIFVHHCDHTLTLGMHLPKYRHVDFRQHGFDNCRNNLGIDNNILCPLTTEDLGCPEPSNRFLNNEGLHTCTSSHYYKLEVPYAFHLTTELPKWLKHTGGTHTHIGELSASVIYTIHQELKKLDIPDNRFKVIPHVPSLWESLIEQKVDVYIDSFPLCGTRSTVEAMGAGIPVVVHHNYANIMWSNIGFVYPQAKIWHNPIDLQNWLVGLDKQTLEAHSKYARVFYLQNHHSGLLANIFNNISTQSEVVWKNIYQTDALRTFMDQLVIPDVTNQEEFLFSLSSLLRTARIIDEDTNKHFKQFMLPNDYQEFLTLKSLFNESIDAISLIDTLHPVLNDDGSIDIAEFSRFLYHAAAALSSAQTQTQAKPINLKAKARLLYHRLQTKYKQVTSHE